MPTPGHILESAALNNAYGAMLFVPRTALPANFWTRYGCIGKAPLGIILTS